MGVYFREKEWGWDKEKDLMGAYFRFNISKGWDRVGLGVGLGVGSEVGFESGQERYKSHRWDYQILSFLLSKKIGWGWGWDWVHISEILYQTTSGSVSMLRVVKVKLLRSRSKWSKS